MKSFFKFLYAVSFFQFTNLQSEILNNLLSVVTFAKNIVIIIFYSDDFFSVFSLTCTALADKEFGRQLFMSLWYICSNG